MVLARTPAPSLEKELATLLKSDTVSKIEFVVPNKEDKTFPHNIYIDGKLYSRVSERLGSYVTIFVAADDEMSPDAQAETKVGGSIYRRQINVRSDVFDKIESKEALLHEITHAALVYDLSKLCREPVKEDPDDLYWALGEVICYVASASFLFSNDASYPAEDKLCSKAYDMAKKAQTQSGHFLQDKDIRTLIALIRDDPAYKKNLTYGNDYWDKKQPTGKSK